MELYGLYYSIVSTMWVMNKTDVQTFYASLLVAAFIWTALFILQGFGIYTMAKRKGMQGAWQAFVPFVNILYMGKVSGECTVFGQKLKRAGLYAMIGQIIATILCAVEVIGMAYLWTTEGTPTLDQYYQPYWSDLQGDALKLNNYLYMYNGFIRSIVQMVYEIMMFIILMGIYKKYAPNSHFALSILSLFVPLSRFIVLFVVRNKDEIDYDAYMRQKREEYMRSRGFTAYGNPYGYNPNAGAQPPRTEKPEDPFEEFDDRKTNNNENDEFFS